PERRKNALEDARWSRRTARYRDIDGDDIRYPPATRVALPKHPAGATAVPQRNDQLRRGRRFVSAQQRRLHVLGDRAGHQQEIRVPGTRHEADAEALEVVERIVERVDFQLAAVAGAGVDVPDAERPAEQGADALLQGLADAQAVVRLRRGLGGDPNDRNLPQRLQHDCAPSVSLEIMAAIGEVEGLVDEREVRNDVVDHRMLEHRPVLPRRIVRVAAADRAGLTRLERDEDGATPTLDQSRADHADRRQVDGAQMRAGRQSRQDLLDEAAGLLHLIEPHRDARGDISLAAAALHQREFRVRRAGHIAAQVERLAARAPG